MRRAAALGALVALAVTGCGSGGGEPGGSTSAPPSPTSSAATPSASSTTPRRAGTAPGSEVARQLEAHLRKTAPGSRADTVRCAPIPRYVGAQVGCSAQVDGQRVSYEARVTSVDGERVFATFRRIGEPSAAIPARPTT